MTLRDEIPSMYAKVDYIPSHRDESDEIAKLTAEFLKRGGKIYEAGITESINIPIFTNIDKDGNGHNDYHSIRKGGARANLKIQRGDTSGIALFSEPKRLPSLSGRMYIKRRKKGDTFVYCAHIHNVMYGDWTEDINEAVETRNASLKRQSIPIPD